MYACEANPLVLSVCVPERLVEFQMLSAGLENCQKSLNDYLDSKRRVFSRYTELVASTFMCNKFQHFSCLSDVFQILFHFYR